MSRGRILFLADACHVHTRRWVQEAIERGFECLVATRRAGAIDGAQVVTIRPGADAVGWFAALPSVRALARRLAPQWIHGHYLTSYGLWAAACRGIAPVVLTAWGSDILVTPRQRGWRGMAARELLAWCLKRADLITADSADVLDEITRYDASAPRYEVLWGVDTLRFRPAEADRVEGARFELISLRQWETNYRIDLVIRAFAAVRAARPALRMGLTLLGGGSLAVRLQALAKDLGLDGDEIRFVGHVDEAGLVSALQGADVSISVPARDATSVAMLESMSCGLPVVASDVPANRQWIDQEQRVPADDLDSLVSALLLLADDPGIRLAIGKRNRQVVLERASRSVHMDRMAALYESVRTPAQGIAA